MFLFWNDMSLHPKNRTSRHNAHVTSLCYLGCCKKYALCHSSSSTTQHIISSYRSPRLLLSSQRVASHPLWTANLRINFCDVGTTHTWTYKPKTNTLEWQAEWTCTLSSSKALQKEWAKWLSLRAIAMIFAYGSGVTCETALLLTNWLCMISRACKRYWNI